MWIPYALLHFAAIHTVIPQDLSVIRRLNFISFISFISFPFFKFFSGRKKPEIPSSLALSYTRTRFLYLLHNLSLEKGHEIFIPSPESLSFYPVLSLSLFSIVSIVFILYFHCSISPI